LGWLPGRPPGASTSPTSRTSGSVSSPLRARSAPSPAPAPGAYGGDNGPATSADLTLPSAVEPFNGGFLISDSGNNRIRFVNSAGIISTVAGTGTPGYNGDNQPATSAQINFPAGLGAVATGFYFADALNSRVRVVTTSNGQSATVAGTGNPVYNGDNIPATSANVGPTDVEATDHGLLIVDQGNDRIRLVSAAGTISTLAGNGVPGYNGSGGTTPALAAQLSNPFGIDQYSTGAMVISDQSNALVRTIAQPPPKACGTRNYNYVSGTRGPDRLRGTHAADLIVGIGGRDRISGLGGRDCLVGGAGADSLKGGPGRDVLIGGKGRDRARCGRGRERLRR
jgi:Ca2+-binding RTX toxin-like protein